MHINDEKFERMKHDAEDAYKRFGSVYCPYFKESIVFNAKGLEHLKFKGRNKARSREDQYVRLRSIRLAPKIVALSHTLQGVLHKGEFIAAKVTGQWKNIAKQITYYEFIAVIDTVRVRVIIRSPEGEQKYFWSIIPFWKVDQITGKRLMHNGFPVED